MLSFRRECNNNRSSSNKILDFDGKVIKSFYHFDRNETVTVHHLMYIKTVMTLGFVSSTNDNRSLLAEIENLQVIFNYYFWSNAMKSL